MSVSIPKVELDAATAALIHERDAEESQIPFFERGAFQAAATDAVVQKMALIALTAAAEVRS